LPEASAEQNYTVNK